MAKILKMKPLFKRPNKFSEMAQRSIEIFDARGAMAIAANRRAISMKVARNTFTASRKNFFEKSKGKYGVLSKKLHTTSLEYKLGKEVADNVRLNLKMIHANQLNKILNTRRKSGKTAYRALRNIDRIAGERSKIDRIVNARAKGITFRRIGGILRPIRQKRKK